MSGRDGYVWGVGIPRCGYSWGGWVLGIPGMGTHPLDMRPKDEYCPP